MSSKSGSGFQGRIQDAGSSSQACPWDFSAQPVAYVKRPVFLFEPPVSFRDEDTKEKEEEDSCLFRRMCQKHFSHWQMILITTSEMCISGPTL